jgi:hypothetical protein
MTSSTTITDLVWLTAKFSSLTFIICPNIVCIWNVYRRLDGEIILRKYLKYGQPELVTSTVSPPLSIFHIRYDHVCLRRRQVH